MGRACGVPLVPLRTGAAFHAPGPALQRSGSVPSGRAGRPVLWFGVCEGTTSSRRVGAGLLKVPWSALRGYWRRLGSRSPSERVAQTGGPSTLPLRSSRPWSGATLPGSASGGRAFGMLPAVMSNNLVRSPGAWRLTSPRKPWSQWSSATWAFDEALGAVPIELRP
jgi:hypothetical protein